MEKAKLSLRHQVESNFNRLLFLKKYITIITAATICLFNTAASMAATATVRYNSVYQQIEGFGGAGCYDTDGLAAYDYNEATYDLLFRDLGLDIFRIKNTYDISEAEMVASAQIVDAARQPTRNPNLKVKLVPWSPPAYLKSNGTINGGTLKKDATDSNNSAPYYYVYKGLANWWYRSLTEPNGWNALGVYPDYISIQNEPDWESTYDTCRYDPFEISSIAGFDKAFEAVYNKLDGNVSPMPKILAPSACNTSSAVYYTSALINRGQLDHIYGFSHHLYGDGTYENPDSIIPSIQSYGDSYGYNPLFMTEFAASGTPTFAHAVSLAQIIHNCLLYEGVTSYIHWTLFRNNYQYGYTGGMVNLKASGPEIRDIYWFFKHYAYFTDPNWYVIGATASPSTNLRMTAFKNPNNNQLTVVILNKSTTEESLTLNLNGFSPDGNVSEVYRSSATEHWSSLGDFNSTEALTLPAESITTIHLTGLQFLTSAEANVTKCNIKAGKIQGQDSFDISGIFTDDFEPALDDINQFDVNIISADGNLIYSEANDFTALDSTTGKFQYTHKIPKGGEGAITSLKLDFNKQTFAIKTKNIDLTGLACPFQLNIRLGESWLYGEVDEPIVNGRKKIIPTRLMRTYDDKLVVIKAKATHSTKPLSDSLSVKGDIAVEDINDLNVNEPNLVTVDVNIVWGDHSFTIPAGRFIAAKTGHSYKCSKILMDINDCNAGFVTAKIDLDKSTFTVSVKNADGLDDGLDDGFVQFGINFGNDDFNEPAEVNVVTGRSY